MILSMMPCALAGIASALCSSTSDTQGCLRSIDAIRKLCNDREETSGQRYKTDVAYPDNRTEQRNTPRLPKGVSRKGSDIRKRDPTHGGCSTGQRAKTTPS